MFFKFCIAAVVLWVHLLIHEANTADNLGLSEPEPEYTFRRKVENTDTKPTKKHLHTKKQTNTTVMSLLREAINASVDEKKPAKSHKHKEKRKRRQGDEKSTRFILEEPDIQTTAAPGSRWWTKKETKSGEKHRISPYSIVQELKSMTSKMHGVNVTMDILGRTAEYNNIVLLKVSESKSDSDSYFRADDSKYVDEVPEKKIVFIVHALSVMGVDKMSVFKYDTFYTKLFSYYFEHLDQFDIFVLPMANPDGYAYAMNREGSSIWNKNLSPQTECAGVALDRNFDVGWNVSNTSSSCSQQYPGPSPFSEPETRAIRDVFHRYSLKIAAYMHLHSGSYDSNSFKGDAVLYPKGYSETQSDDDKYIDLKGEIDESMKNASFKYVSVTVDTLHNWYGKVLGTSVDYASTVYGIPYAMELVMQIYGNNENLKKDEELQSIALEEIWKRVIDVIFKSIWKNLHANDVQ